MSTSNGDHGPAGLLRSNQIQDFEDYGKSSLY